MSADIGMVGLAVMGENLVLNMASKGIRVAVFNRSTEKVKIFVSERGKSDLIIGTYSLEELVSKLKKPRKVMLMIMAGNPIDQQIKHLIPLLEEGDIIIDGGNSYYPDTTRRVKELQAKKILFVGTGVSGGEEGALKGPSLMPGGSPEAWPYIKDIFQKIAAKVENNVPCCDWVGEEGSGHFVKMVHNGIEYGDMQLICEAYQVLKSLLGLSNQEIHDVFDEWNKGDLDSYLIEISRDIFAKKDENGEYVVDQILDTAGQKGTGKWTVTTALDLGMPVTMIAEAVFSRCLSAMKEDRVVASKILKGPSPAFKGDKKQMIDNLRDAVFASKLVSYAQGYLEMRAAAKESNWKLNYGGIALMWRGGCIIRSKFLGKIKEAFDTNPNLSNLLLDPYFQGKLEKAQEGWRSVCCAAIMNGIPLPGISSALNYYDGYRCERLPANLLQGQRDFFGGHTYERIDQPRGKFFHTNWTGHGGNTHSSTYNV